MTRPADRDRLDRLALGCIVCCAICIPFWVGFALLLWWTA